MAFEAPVDLVATANGASQIDVTWTNSENYEDIYVEYDAGSGWTSVTEIDGSLETYSHEDVVANTTYNYRVYGTGEEENSGYSNTDSATCWASAPTAMVYVSGNVLDYVVGTDYTDTLTGTIYVSGIVLEAQSLKTTYAYYVGDSNGKIYQYSAAYTGDAGSSIPARWESKDTDFADQSMEWADKFKTIEKVRLHYIDKTSDATVSLLISTDGGATWDSKTRSIGTGDGKGKTADFFLIKTGQIFRFAIVNASASDDFQFVGLEAFYSPGGDYFEI